MESQSGYKDTLHYLYERLPMFSRTGKDAIKKDLHNIRRLCTELGNPQDSFRSIHIAGTNGKGSTSHALASVLSEAGYKVGLYTSPHLVDFRERIRINGVPVPEQWVVDFVAARRELIESIQPSFFEVTVAMAFQFFMEEKIDFAVIETGLGGRLDSTNIITPILSIITNIDYDHKDVLGNSLEEIAAEKAGIIKPGVPALIGEQRPETDSVFFRAALKQQTTLYPAEALWDLVKTGSGLSGQSYKAVHKVRMEMVDIRTDLAGSYQMYNLRNVLAAVEILNAAQGLNIGTEVVQRALAAVRRLSGLRGRWELLAEQPVIIADVAHNPAGLTEVMRQWKDLPAAEKFIVAGFVRDKDVSEALGCFPQGMQYIFCQADIPRALPAAELVATAAERGLAGSYYGTVREAVAAALDKMSPQDALLITGSFFIVGEAISYLGERQLRIARAGTAAAAG